MYRCLDWYSTYAWGTNEYSLTDTVDVYKSTRSKKSYKAEDMKTKGKPGTGYGEILCCAMERILNLFMYAKMNFPDIPAVSVDPLFHLGAPNTSFLDIGSGYGKAVWHAYMKSHAPAHGMEFMPARH